MGRPADQSETLEVRFLGNISWERADELQRTLHGERAAGERGDVLLLLTHAPVVTLGRGADPAHLRLTPEEYADRGIAVFETDRGGDVTYHGPGQLVGYPIVDLRSRGLGPRSFLRLLEESLILLLADLGVRAGRVEGLTGVWVGEEKVAALGIRVSRGVTLHGFALNVATDPAEFDVIVPCGIRDRGVTSLDRLLRTPLSVEEVARRYPPCLTRLLPAASSG